MNGYLAKIKYNTQPSTSYNGAGNLHNYSYETTMAIPYDYTQDDLKRLIKAKINIPDYKVIHSISVIEKKPLKEINKPGDALRKMLRNLPKTLKK